MNEDAGKGGAATENAGNAGTAVGDAGGALALGWPIVDGDEAVNVRLFW